MNNLEPFVIISAERLEYNAAVNSERTTTMRRALEAGRLTFVAVNGAYKGHREAGFLILLPDGDSGPDYILAVGAALAMDQETVLYVDSRREAYLDDGRGGQIRIGQWREVPADGPLPESYTEKGGRYYAAL